MNQLDQSDFINWLEHPVTSALYSRLKNLDESLQEMLLNPSVMLEQDGQIRYARVIGSRELIERILELTINDLIDNEEIDEKTP